MGVLNMGEFNMGEFNIGVLNMGSSKIVIVLIKIFTLTNKLLLLVTHSALR